MTVAVYTKPAERTDDLVEVAEAFGVLVDSDLTKKQSVPIDQTGGLDRLDEILREKTSAHEAVTVESSTVERPTIVSRVRSVLRAVKAWARQAVQVARDALAYLAEPFVEFARRHRLNRKGTFYRPRHGTRRAWFGVQRSSAERVAIQRRRATRQPTDSEPALPEHFVSYLALTIEAMRGHEDALHPRAGYQFRC